jgi:hypothetical protein
MEILDTKIIVALIAVFVSFIGLIISKEQKTSEFRQAWINTLRDDISRFIGQLDSTAKLVLINKTSKSEDKEETSSAVIKDSVKLREIKSKIELLINPREQKHIQLVSLLTESIENIKKLESNSSVVDRITNISQKILKEEWKRVKDGEPFFKFFRFAFGLAIVGIILYSLYALVCK